MAHPNETELYGGLAGGSLDVDRFDLGQGVYVSRTYAHVFAPQLAAFSRAPAGQPHPPPWKALRGGTAFDIEAEIHIPAHFAPAKWFDRLNTLWWIFALLRLRAGPQICMPVVSEMSFTAVALAKGEPQIWPVDMSRRVLLPVHGPALLGRTEFEWLAAYWSSAGRLMGDNPRFNLAMQAFDEASTARTYALGTLALWTALEAAFAHSTMELSFQISASIAGFLEPPGAARLALFRNAKSLYGKRSRITHGDEPGTEADFVPTYELAQRALLAIIKAGKLPTRGQFEETIFRPDAN